MKVVYLVALTAGTLSALQSAVNTRLSQFVGGPTMSATISVLITAICLIIATLITRAPLPTATTLGAAPWWTWTGGLIGAAFLVSIIYAIQGLSVAGAISLVMAAQIVTSIVLDHLGVHGGTPVPFTLWRGVGAVLMITGVWLINKQS